MDPTMQPGYAYDQPHPQGPPPVYEPVYPQMPIPNQNAPSAPPAESEITGFCGCPIRLCVGVLTIFMTLSMLGSWLGTSEHFGSFLAYNLWYTLVVVTLLYTFLAKEPLPNYVWPAKINAMLNLIGSLVCIFAWLLVVLFFPKTFQEFRDWITRDMKPEQKDQFSNGLIIAIVFIAFFFEFFFAYVRYVLFHRYQMHLKQARARFVGDNVYRVVIE